MARTPSGRDEQPVDLQRRAVLQSQYAGAADCADAGHPNPCSEGDPVAGKGSGHVCGGVRALARQDPARALDDGHLRAETGESLTELAPDAATAEDGQARGELAEVPHALAVERGSVGETGDRRKRGGGAGADDGLTELERLRPHLRAVRAGEREVPGEDADALGLQSGGGVDRLDRADDGADVLHDLCEVHGDSVDVDPQTTGAAGRGCLMALTSMQVCVLIKILALN
jgi:hypothetical protein